MSGNKRTCGNRNGRKMAQGFLAGAAIAAGLVAGSGGLLLAAVNQCGWQSQFVAGGTSIQYETCPNNKEAAKCPISEEWAQSHNICVAGSSSTKCIYNGKQFGWTDYTGPGCVPNGSGGYACGPVTEVSNGSSSDVTSAPC